MGKGRHYAGNECTSAYPSSFLSCIGTFSVYNQKVVLLYIEYNFIVIIISLNLKECKYYLSFPEYKNKE